MTDPTTAPAAASGRPTALVLDVDGTLLDTVYLHVIAWWEAFRDAGHQVSGFDIHRAIGRGSEDLVETLLGEPDEKAVEGHSQNWAPLREQCIPFHQVPELIREVAGRGVKVVYCTSGSEQDTEHFREKIGCDDVVAAVVSSGDVEQSKPAPDIVRAALDASASRRRTPSCSATPSTTCAPPTPPACSASASCAAASASASCRRRGAGGLRQRGGAVRGARRLTARAAVHRPFPSSGLNRSPIRSTRASTSSDVNTRSAGAVQASTSSQVTGVDTVGRSRARSE
jgi:hypothetical protein